MKFNFSERAMAHDYVSFSQLIRCSWHVDTNGHDYEKYCCLLSTAHTGYGLTFVLTYYKMFLCFLVN